MECHGGFVDVATKQAAHEGMVRDPSEDPKRYCGECHAEIAQASLTSLHTTLAGEKLAIETRADIEPGTITDHPELFEGWKRSCSGCHATCGQCHVSRPNSAGGGFVDGHRFKKEPNQINQCTACHGSRVGNDYLGKNLDEGGNPLFARDIHSQKGKKCGFCHTGVEMHEGSGQHRLDTPLAPACEDCHAETENANGFHAVHWGELQCQVCHSQGTAQCAGCHVTDTGYIVEEDWIGFKIGRNPMPELRPYDYVVLRHEPTDRETYLNWGYEGGLPNLEELPTWKYAAPHNVRRWTPRTEYGPGETCATACHDTPATPEGYFLRQVDIDLRPHLTDANQQVIVPDTNPMDWAAE